MRNLLYRFTKQSITRGKSPARVQSVSVSLVCLVCIMATLLLAAWPQGPQLSFSAAAPRNTTAAIAVQLPDAFIFSFLRSEREQQGFRDTPVSRFWQGRSGLGCWCIHSVFGRYDRQRGLHSALRPLRILHCQFNI